MKDTEIRRALVEEIGNLAPEADLADLPEDADLRDRLDLDSMDFLNLMIALDKRLGVAIPEADYGRLRTLHDALAYLAERLP
jgi:acyl carrier protein